MPAAHWHHLDRDFGDEHFEPFHDGADELLVGLGDLDGSEVDPHADDAARWDRHLAEVDAWEDADPLSETSAFDELAGTIILVALTALVLLGSTVDVIVAGAAMLLVVALMALALVLLAGRDAEGRSTS